MIDADLLAQVAEETTVAPSDEQLKTVAWLAKKQQRLEMEVAQAEETLDAKKKDLAKVAELDLPDALAAVGMSEFTLDDGYKVSVGEEVHANIPSDSSEKPELLLRRENCFKYLRDTGNEALIKHQISVETGKGEDQLAEATKKALDEAGILYNDTEAVHWQTLRAFVREQLEKQTPGFPKETFGVHVKKVASIKAPRKRK